MTTKASHYIELLDKARCESDWASVPELVRKIRKHAPTRKCLTTTAETECAVAQIGPSSSISDTAKELDVPNTIPKLAQVIGDETENPQDVYQAESCMGWMHWVVAEYELALHSLPKGLGKLDAEKSLSEWTSVCVLKSAYLRSNCLMRDGKRTAALDAFHSALPSLDRVWSGHGIGKQLRYWSELFLTEYCTLSSDATRMGEVSPQDPSCTACYRSWARYWEAMSAPVTGGTGFKGSASAVPRRKIWNDYYRTLSTTLQNDLPFTPGNFGKASRDTPPRSQLRAELKRVEAAYERLLMSETQFPRADEERQEVEEFVEEVAKNWTVLCGRGWSEQDLGQGGRTALSRGVLETLYNASTRTYHSTAILRSLFSVHISLAEFDLAFKALDSYLEIVKKGKARVAKTGIEEASLDDDGIVLETMSQAVLTLCLHGHPRSAEKARVLGAELEDWLSKLPQAKVPDSADPTPEPLSTALQTVSPPVISQAWQAIGLSHAYWSRATYEAGSRAEIQARAIRCLRRSLSPEFGRSKDMRSLFAASLLLAERKELATAIELVRSALISDKEGLEEYSLEHGSYWQERSLIPLWHLLSLLLSARQDYPMAARACEGALDQFKDPTLLFGKHDLSSRSESVAESEEKETIVEPQYGLVDEMDDFEKEGILEVKMTQLALVELQDGPNAAVNASYELLTLFTRLFGNVTVQPVTNQEPPKTSRGSIRGSIFGGRSGPPTRQTSNAAFTDNRGTNLPLRPGTSQTITPAIQVVDDVSRPPRSRRSNSAQRSDSGRRNSLKKRNRSGSRSRPGSVNSVSLQPTVVDGEPFFTPTTEVPQPDMTAGSKVPNPRLTSLSREKTVSSLKSILTANSKASDHNDLSPEHAYVTPHMVPLVQFSREKERAKRVTILVKVWMMIAGFYRRAEMLDEAKAAIAEGQKLVQSLETEAARDPSTSGSLSGSIWSEKKSIEDLWGDVYSELGQLSLAKNQPLDARADFESALTHCPDHPGAIVGLSNILLDIYNEKVRPLADPALADSSATVGPASQQIEPATMPSRPLGLGPASRVTTSIEPKADATSRDEPLPVPYKATSLALVDRIAARDRAYTLLSGLTRLGSSWDNAEAWFTLARAHEESGQPDKAKEVLWWCVELEESTGIRDWRSLASGGYIV